MVLMNLIKAFCFHLYSAEQNQACDANVIELNMGRFARRFSLQNHENNQFGTRGVYTMALRFTLKTIVRQKKNLNTISLPWQARPTNEIIT